MVAALVVVGAMAPVAIVALAGRDDEPDQASIATSEVGGVVILYGDSLSWEASGAFVGRLESESRARGELRVVPGAAICDLLPVMREDAARVEPDVAVLAFVGNNASPCVAGLRGQELADRYATDAATATGIFAPTGTSVVWAGVPAAPGLPGQASELIDRGYRRLVEEWADRSGAAVSYAPAGEAVTGPDGAYVDTLPCQPDEGPKQGCTDGRIAVRSPDRIHFCPIVTTERCPVYSSGSRRFGEAMAAGALAALVDRARPGR